MDFTRSPTDSVWELGGVVSDTISFVVAAIEGPTVVDVDILIAGIFQSQVNDLLRCDLELAIILF